jgi:hypothetical protein
MARPSGGLPVVLPDREVPIGALGPGDEIVRWRDGAAYGATLRRGPQPSSEKAYAAAAGDVDALPAAARGRAAASAPSPADPGFLDLVFKKAGIQPAMKGQPLRQGASESPELDVERPAGSALRPARRDLPRHA